MRKKVKQKKAKIKKKIELLFIIMFILAKQIWNVITIKKLTGRSDYVLSLVVLLDGLLTSGSDNVNNKNFESFI
jgi:hypothetical protein